MAGARAGSETVLAGQGGRFGAVGRTQFGEDIAHMIFNGRNSDMQLGGDLGVGKPFDKESQNLAFPFGQVIT